MPAETEPFRTDTAPSAAVLDAVIIGAGFSGLYLLHQLRDQLGLSVRVLEAGAGVGGTWYWNRYPGARCDSESYSYCYSFDPDLMQEWNWSQRYPEAAEIRQYLDHVADRFDLRRSIISTAASPRRPSTSSTNLWTIRTGGPQLRGTLLHHRGRVLVLRQHPQHSRPRSLQRSMVPYRALAA